MLTLFFLQVELAMEGKNLDLGNQLWYFRQMKEMEFHIFAFGNHMQQIIVVEKDIEPTPCTTTKVGCNLLV
jgi:hypothetical protein